MRPPEFWKANASGRDAAMTLRAVLTPISWAYAWEVARRLKSTPPRHANVPVICVGNFTVGGGGKTPVTRAIRSKLGPAAHSLSRGYGGRVEGPLRVTPNMDAREVGDEPLLHAADGEAWIARDRHAGAMAATNAGARAIIMDDGFQNASLAKDLSIIVVDAGYGVGNGQVFPAGPLRERLKDGMARADAIVLLRTADIRAQANDNEDSGLEWLAGFKRPILHAELTPVGDRPEGKFVAFAGLARPEKFFDTLNAAEVDLTDAIPFEDHHLYSDDDFAALEALAAEHGARLITTEKDAARLSPEQRARVAVLPVTARFDDDAAFDALLEPIRQRMS
ncbi:MAG: tetraacyldisaccharide 4'-kinase [Terricaulis sp.]